MKSPILFLFLLCYREGVFPPLVFLKIFFVFDFLQSKYHIHRYRFFGIQPQLLESVVSCLSLILENSQALLLETLLLPLSLSFSFWYPSNTHVIPFAISSQFLHILFCLCYCCCSFSLYVLVWEVLAYLHVH